MFFHVGLAKECLVPQRIDKQNTYKEKIKKDESFDRKRKLESENKRRKSKRKERSENNKIKAAEEAPKWVGPCACGSLC